MDGSADAATSESILYDVVMAEPLPRRAQDSGEVPLGWRLGFAALVLAVLGFMVWAVTLVQEVRAVRYRVEHNVAWLQQAQQVQRATVLWASTGQREPPQAWVTGIEQLEQLASEAAVTAMPVQMASERARSEGSPVALSELQGALDSTIAEVRRSNTMHSIALGAHWDDITVLVIIALLLAGSVVGLIGLVEMRRRQAVHLAVEIEVAADQLAETRAELREQEAVARLAGELRLARDRAEEASAAKTRFMTTMSHELLTPLNIILGYAELVRERCEEHALAEVTGDVDKLESAAQGLYRLLRHVLDLTELDSGVFEVEQEQVDMAALLSRIAGEAEPVAARNGTTVTIEAPPDLWVYCDRRRLETVVAEAVGNACRFTRGGRVTLRAGAELDGVRIEVEDDGPGMRPEDVERATTPFFQADSSSTRAHDGVGLGLTVAARLSARMGGSLALRSAPGRGTTLTIQVPVHPHERGG
jgi:signal transduction histidine kinase